MWIKRIHHISMKCGTQKEAAAVIAFYSDLLEIPITRRWDTGFILDSGDTQIEVFTNGDGAKCTGSLRHIAFEVDDVDALAAAVSQAGYEVFLSPRDILQPMPARIAFCFGPLGEQIEFFCPKSPA